MSAGDWIRDRKRPDGMRVDRFGHGVPVRLLLDFGTGEHESDGRAHGPYDGELVFSDGDGWCTQYVKGWKPVKEGK